MRTDIGHMAISHNENNYELFPTFKNIRKICEPCDLPELFARLFGFEVDELSRKLTSCDNNHIAIIGQKSLYGAINKIHDDAAFVIQCCCELDTESLTGRMAYRNGRKVWKIGAMDANDLLVIARSLMINGLVGKQPAKGNAKNDDRDSSDTIDVYSYVEIAMAHLGMSYNEAEQLTKTELDRLLKAKFPDAKPKKKIATLADHQANIAKLKEINARRDAKKKGVN